MDEKIIAFYFAILAAYHVFTIVVLVAKMTSPPIRISACPKCPQSPMNQGMISMILANHEVIIPII